MLKKYELNGSDDKMIAVYIDGRNQWVSNKWFEQYTMENVK